MMDIFKDGVQKPVGNNIYEHIITPVQIEMIYQGFKKRFSNECPINLFPEGHKDA